jgi:hypothetical protein
MEIKRNALLALAAVHTENYQKVKGRENSQGALTKRNLPGAAWK